MDSSGTGQNLRVLVSFSPILKVYQHFGKSRCAPNSQAIASLF